MSAQSFPNQLAAIPTPALLVIYDQAAPRLGQLLAGLSAEELFIRARGADKWSIGEIICHLADSEIVAATRFRLMRTRRDAPVVTYDQDVLAEELRYQDRGEAGVWEALRTFEALRHSTGRIMRMWTGRDWERRGDHPDWGAVTLRQLLELYAEHGERHLDQLLDLRNRLEKPMPLASILPYRLDRDAWLVAEAVGGAA